jgi:murein DD-endopeptidase MepM/ murein hydrolase activator NlpD
VNVLETTWTVDSVTVPASLAPLLDPAVQADETNLLTAVYSKVTGEKLWKPGWLQPVGGGITTRFGEVRSYNGSPPAGHHSGTDIGANAGIEVGATNNGRVVLARQLRLRGNMVVVDHGGGLFSGYAHLSSFAVAEGQAVQAGDTVGMVGSTGLSTGAHLHWEMASDGVVVDAFRFMDGTNGF